MRLWKKSLILVFLFLFFSNAKSVLASPGTDSMLGYWKFDGNASDSSGDGCDGGTLNGGAQYNASNRAPTQFLSSQSIEFFNNNNCYINNFSNIGHLEPTSALTFAIWVYLKASPTQSAVIGGNYQLGTDQGFRFQLDNLGSSVYFEIGDGTLPSGSGPHAPFSLSLLTPGTWHHLAGTWDGSTIRIYLDGTNVGSQSYTGPVAYFPPAFEFGRGLNGMVDDARLYDRALTSSEISDLAAGNHTSANWIGNYSADYEDASNWNTTYVPDPYTRITVATTGTYQPEFTTGESMAGLTINSGTSLDLHNYNLAVNDAGTFSNSGTLKLESSASQTITGLAMDANSGTVEIDNPANTNVLETGSSYNNLIINAGTNNVTLSAALVVNRNLSLESGNLSFSTGGLSVSVGGDWIKGSGTFVPGTSTVDLTGGDQTIYGTNTFYNLTKNSSVSDTLGFESGQTQTILNTLDLQGSASYALNLRSSSPGTPWLIDPQGARTLGNLDVMDSDNINATKISATSGNIVNSGNNTNWIFDAVAPTITLNSYSAITSNTKMPITGTALKLSSTVALVEFQMDSTSGSWTSCSANDGAFGSASEAFTCTPASDLSNGTHSMYIRATDADGYTTQSASYSVATFQVNTAAPAISSVSEDANDDNAEISWSTDKNSSSLVEYGKTSNYGKETAEADIATGVKSHSVSLTGLSTCTRYHYRVKSADAYGNQAISADYDFKTSGCSSCDNPGKPKLDDAAAAGTDAIKISFTKADGTVNHYELKYGTTLGNYEWSADDIGGKKIDHYTVGQLSPSTTYYFKVRAANDCGKGNWSSEISGKTDALTIATTSSAQASAAAANASSLSSPPTQAATPSSQSTAASSNFNGTTSEDWQVKYFGSAYCQDALRCGGEADPDGDGVSNNEEFRLGTNPLSADSDNDGFPDAQEIESGHDPLKSAASAGGDAITYESPKDNGEVKKNSYAVKNVEMVDDNGNKKLKISGKGPPNTFVTVYIYSDPIVLTVKTDGDGNWSYVLDQDVGDGQHEVYVAVTDNTGKVAEKSDPLSFIKTAEAVTIIPPAEAAAAEKAQSPTEAWYKGGIFLFISIVVAGLMLALGSIGIYKHRISKKIETPEIL